MSEILSGSKKVWNGLDMIPDRRKHTRRRYPRLQVKFDTVLQFEKTFCQCTMVDISQKGCQLIIEKQIQGMTEHVIIKFMVPGQLDPIFTRGRIRWKGKTEKGYLIGIEFEKLIPNLNDLL